MGSNQKSAVDRCAWSALELVVLINTPSFLVTGSPRSTTQATSGQKREEPARAIEKPWPDSSWRQITPERELVHVKPKDEVESS